MNTVLLINTKSRQGREMKPQLEESLAKNNISIHKTLEVNRRNSIDELLKEIKTLQPALLIVCGGDGTVNHVIEYFHDTAMRLAIIPAGTTNNLARSLEIPFDIDSAVAVIKNHRAKAVDLGVINDAVVSNVMGVGVSASIASNVTNTMKGRFGRLAYGVTGVVQLIRHSAFEAKIHDIDKDFEAHVRTHQLIIANGRYHAGKEIVEENSLDNGQLVIFTLGGKSRLGMVFQLLKYYVTSRNDYNHPSYFIGRHVKIELNSDQKIEIDGEVLPERTRTLEAKTIKSTLRVHRA